MHGIEVALVGKIGRDPDLKTSQAGKHWTAISIAVGKDDDLQWVRASAFGEKAEQFVAELRKGMSVCMEGKDLRIDMWTAQDGQQRTSLKCIATRVEVLGEIGNRRPPKPKAPAESDQAAASTRDWQAPLPDPMPAGGGRMPIDDAIPFTPEVR